MKLPQIACVTRPIGHQVKAMTPLAEGLRRHGFRVRETYDRCPPEDIVACWGWGWAKEIRAKFPRTTILCIDHGLFSPRKETVVTGWQGLNGFGEHPVVDDGGERLHQKGWDKVIQPWRETGAGKALILGQVYRDAMIVDAVEDYTLWLQARSRQLQMEGLNVKFRPHPVQSRVGNDVIYGNVAPKTDWRRSLYEDLEEHGTVLAMNSNGLLDALMFGVPDVRLYNKGSMLYPISRAHNPETGERRVDRTRREALANRLAWCQWQPHEVGSDTWMKLHLPILHRVLDNSGKHSPWWTHSV